MKQDECGKKERMSYEVPFLEIDMEKYGNCKCKVCEKRKKEKEHV